MSYDFYMTTDLGSGEISLEQFQRNYTHNVAPMFYKAFPGKEGINSLNGLLGSKAGGLIKKDLEYMQDNEEAMEALNPCNGGGPMKEPWCS